MSIPELSIHLKNAPGQLARLTEILADAGVNIRGLAASSAGNTGWVHMIVDKTRPAETALEHHGLAVETGEALAVVSHDRPGALNAALQLLAEKKVNVDYIYTCVTHTHGKVVTVLGVQSPMKIEKLLNQHDVETAQTEDF